MPILKTVRRVPGGLMIVPLLLGALVNTLFPQAIQIGGFTEAMFKTGSSAILGVFLFCNGSQINVKQAGQPLLKGVVLTFVKFIIGAGIGLLVNMVFGPAGFFTSTPGCPDRGDHQFQRRSVFRFGEPVRRFHRCGRSFGFVLE